MRGLANIVLYGKKCFTLIEKNVLVKLLGAISTIINLNIAAVFCYPTFAS